VCVCVCVCVCVYVCVCVFVGGDILYFMTKLQKHNHIII